VIYHYYYLGAHYHLIYLISRSFGVHVPRSGDVPPSTIRFLVFVFLRSHTVLLVLSGCVQPTFYPHTSLALHTRPLLHTLSHHTVFPPTPLHFVSFRDAVCILCIPRQYGICDPCFPLHCHSLPCRGVVHADVRYCSVPLAFEPSFVDSMFGDCLIYALLATVYAPPPPPSIRCCSLFLRSICSVVRWLFVCSHSFLCSRLVPYILSGSTFGLVHVPWLRSPVPPVRSFGSSLDYLISSVWFVHRSVGSLDLSLLGFLSLAWFTCLATTHVVLHPAVCIFSFLYMPATTHTLSSPLPSFLPAAPAERSRGRRFHRWTGEGL